MQLGSRVTRGRKPRRASPGICVQQMPGFPFYIAIPTPLGKRRSRPRTDEVAHGGIDGAEFVCHWRISGNIKFKSCTRPATSSTPVAAPGVFHRERFSISHALNAASADQSSHEPAFAVSFGHRRFRIASLPPQEKPPVIGDFRPDDGEQFRIGCLPGENGVLFQCDSASEEFGERHGNQASAIPQTGAMGRLLEKRLDGQTSS